MQTIKKILTLLFEPLKAFSNRNVAEKVSKFFMDHKWMIYVVSFLLTLLILFLTYILQ